VKGPLKRTWIIGAAAAVALLLAGAVAWAAVPGADSAVAAEVSAADLRLAPAAGAGFTAAGLTDEKTRQAFREERRERMADRAERGKALMDLARDKMTPADQAAYDKLVETAKQQREALQEAREALRSTLEQLRDLVDKYVDRAESATLTQ
jgi:hypothetical protein